jgi:ribosomal protein S18 acetylase RimI-like enzyme
MDSWRYEISQRGFLITKHISLTKNPDDSRLFSILAADRNHPHVHLVDMPYRLASTWQDSGCALRIWERGEKLLAWALFQPPWWNLDYVLHPSERGSLLEQEILMWGIQQMKDYAASIGDDFYGSVEFFENTPGVDQTVLSLESLGFREFDWSIVRFEKDLDQGLPRVNIPDGYLIRPLAGREEVDRYVELHRAAFNSNMMTTAWRRRTLEHRLHQPEFDLVAIDTEGKFVGFCIGWGGQDAGQIEPLGVHPDHQGKGLGRALELTAFQAFQKAGIQKALVDHASTNREAISLSLKMGFKQTHRALRYFIEIEP